MFFLVWPSFLSLFSPFVWSTMDYFFFVSVFFLFPPAPSSWCTFCSLFPHQIRFWNFVSLVRTVFTKFFSVLFFSFISSFFSFLFSFLLIGRSKLIFFQRENEFCNQEINIFVKKKRIVFLFFNGFVVIVCSLSFSGFLLSFLSPSLFSLFFPDYVFFKRERMSSLLMDDFLTSCVTQVCCCFTTCVVPNIQQ